MRVAQVIHLTDEDRVTLTKWSRGRSTPARLAQRAKILLAAAEGLENQEIALTLGCTRRTVSTWRKRFAQSGLSGIQQDAPRGGRTGCARQNSQNCDDHNTLQRMLPVHAGTGIFQLCKVPSNFMQSHRNRFRHDTRFLLDELSHSKAG